MNYYNIDFLKNYDANSYYRITANIKLLDDRFDQYSYEKGYGWMKLWGDDKLAPFYEGMPKDIKGKLMSHNKNYDYWEKRGLSGGVSGIVAIVSQKFIDTLDKVQVSHDEYYINPIEVVNSRGCFYMLFVPMMDYDIIDFNESILRRRTIPYDIQHITDSDMIKSSQFLQDFEIIKAFAKEPLRSHDIINIRGVPNYFVSERVLKALEQEGIKGFQIDNRYQLIVRSMHGTEDDPSSITESLEFNPLSDSVINNDIKTFTQLLSDKTLIEKMDCNGLAPLYYSALYNRTKMAEMLISQGANIECRDKYGNTPLLIACMDYMVNGDEMIELLVSSGADIMAKNKHGLSPKQYAEEKHDFPKILKLVKKS